MRTSILALTLLAIQLGPGAGDDAVRIPCASTIVIAVILLAVGTVTPFMKFSRVWSSSAGR
ncbi:MAG: hypothetical protein ABI277_18095 [Burkholderiaceae bacterium]